MNTKTLLFAGAILAIAGLSMAFLPVTSFDTRTGQDYALFFAVDRYENMDDLQNPIRNANELAAELRDNFGFQVEVVLNATLDEIDAKLDEYERKFNNGTFQQQGQLFVYFTGHGVSVGNNGYFMTRNADPTRPQRTAMEYGFYRNKIDGLACQHIMVVVDACHSATFDPLYGSRSNRRLDRPGEREFDRIRANHKQYHTRIFWTSDAAGKETPDRSNFAYKLLEGLRSYQNARAYVRSSEFFTLYMEEATPRPGGGAFGQDEPNGCFLFFRPGNSTSISTEEEQLWQQVEQQDAVSGYDFYLQKYPEGHFFADAKNAIKRLEGREDKPARSWIFDGFIAPSYEIGVNTELGQKNWITQYEDSYILRYPGQQDWGVVFFSVGNSYRDKQMENRLSYDFSGYSTLMVDMKSEVRGTSIEIGMKDRRDLNNGAETKIQTTLSTEWTTYSFPLSEFQTADLEILHIPIEFVFGRDAATVEFRNIRLN